MIGTDSRILIVDDEADIRALLRIHLSKEGFATDESEGWRTTFERITSFNPHVVLLNIRMAELPGDRLVKAIKEWRPEIKIIIVSGVLTESLKTQCLADGAFAVLEKPVDFGKLSATIRTALEKRGVDSKKKPL